MRKEPAVKRAITFFDGQNLHLSAQKLFETTHPNYDPLKLSKTICKLQGWKLSKVMFYTGIPHKNDDPFWNHFWVAKFSRMGRQHINTYSRPIRYGKEKGIDIKIALDMVRMARMGEYDIGVLFSQDQDLSEAITEIKDQAYASNKWIRLVSAFPYSDDAENRRGVNGTDWIKIDKKMYSDCIDPADYRLKR